MGAPAFLVCDTDALIQLMLAAETRPLRIFKAQYGIQPIVVPEVEIELASNRRYGARIKAEVKKALANSLIRVLDQSLLDQHYGNSPAGGIAAYATMAEIYSLGRVLSRYADTGEAYTHAAAIKMDAPSLSNDRTALNALLNNRCEVPKTVLQTFDTLVFCYQVGAMTEADCDRFRQTMFANKEYVPACFRRVSFIGGLPHYSPRIYDSTKPMVGSNSVQGLPFATPIIL